MPTCPGWRHAPAKCRFEEASILASKRRSILDAKGDLTRAARLREYLDACRIECAV